MFARNVSGLCGRSHRDQASYQHGCRKRHRGSETQRLRARIQFATLCWTLYLAGWNDGMTGPLLPRLQRGFPVIMHVADAADTGR